MEKQARCTFLFILIPLSLSLLFIGCGSDKEKRPELIPVTLRLQWTIQCQFAGYYSALEEGFYREAGLDVTIREGGYGKDSLETVAYGREEFGTKWPSDIIVSGKPLISLANVVKDNGLRLGVRKDSGISSPADLRGKRASIWFINNEAQLFSLLGQFGLDPDSDVEVVPQRWDLSQLLNREVEAFSLMSYNELLQLEREGFPREDLRLFDYRDYGLGFPGQSLFTSREYAAENPEVCRRFVEASLRGWSFTAEHPGQAVRHVLAHDKNQLLDAETQRAQMEEILRLLQLKEYPLGKNLPEDYRRITEVYKKYGLISEEVDPEDYYTNAFLP